MSRDAPRLPLSDGHGSDADLSGQHFGGANCLDSSLKRSLFHKRPDKREINIHQQYVYLNKRASPVNSTFMNTQHSGERLREVLEERGISYAAFGGSVNASPQNINNWLIRGVPKAQVRRVCSLLKLNIDWLEDGVLPKENKDFYLAAAAGVYQSGLSQAREHEAEIDGPIEEWGDDTPLPDDVVALPFLKEVELSAGAGRTAVEMATNRQLRFGKHSLRNRNVQADHAVAVSVCGNSMEPVMPDGTTVAVNRADTRIVDGKTYALNHGGQLRVKLLYRLPGGGIRIRSHNREEHPDEDYAPQQVLDQEINVIGRVFWVGMYL